MLEDVIKLYEKSYGDFIKKEQNKIENINNENESEDEIYQKFDNLIDEYSNNKKNNEILDYYNSHKKYTNIFIEKCIQKSFDSNNYIYISILKKCKINYIQIQKCLNKFYKNINNDNKLDPQQFLDLINHIHSLIGLENKFVKNINLDISSHL